MTIKRPKRLIHGSMTKKRRRLPHRWVVCVANPGYAASLERRKLYRSLMDQRASWGGLIRVIDESGESYFYPSEFFRPIRVTAILEEALRRGARQSKR